MSVTREDFPLARSPQQDQRRAQRWHDLCFLKVVDDDTEQILGRVADFSTTGMRVHGTIPLPVGRRFSFRLQANDTLLLAAPLFVDGTCRWSGCSRRAGYFESGVEFEPITREVRSLLFRLRDRVNNPDPVFETGPCWMERR